MSDILREAAAAAAEEEAILKEPLIDEPMEAVGASPSGRLEDLLPDFSILLSKTGPGSIEEYIDHPMNFKRSRGLAQILRGCTGMAGSLDYAIVDIALGAFQYMKEGKENAEVTDRE